MANEIKVETGVTGETIYAVARNAAGDAWDGEAFVTYDETTRSAFALEMTEYGATGFYGPIDLPGTGLGRWWQVYRQNGGSPSHDDDDRIATGENDANANVTHFAGEAFDADASFTSDDRTKLEAVHEKLPSKAYLAGTDEASGNPDDDIITSLVEAITGGPAFRPGTVEDSSPSATQFDGDSTLPATNDFFNGGIIAFTSGTLRGLARKIADYGGSSRSFTVSTAFPSAPVDGDSFIIIGRIETVG